MKQGNFGCLRLSQMRAFKCLSARYLTPSAIQTLSETTSNVLISALSTSPTESKSNTTRS